jgi:hypothetical protein
MSRTATKTDIVRAVMLFSQLPRQRGVPTDVVVEAYELALEGVPVEALEQGTRNLLKRARLLPSPSDLFQEIKRLEEPRPREKEHGRRLEEGDDVLTPGQKLGYPLLGDDAAGRERCQALWERVRPSLGAKGFDDAAKDMAALRRQHPAGLTDQQRIEQLIERRDEPVQVSEALLKALEDKAFV